MKKHLKYAWYIARHKWFVFAECCKLGIPLAGIVHDWSKFLPSEWMPYAEFFYGTRQKTEGLDAIGLFGCCEAAPYGFYVKEKFSIAWNHHQNRNPHHWQYWVIHEDSGKVFPIDMPLRYRKEMLADWRGAGRAITGKSGGTIAWYLKNKENMMLHPATRAWVEDKLGIVHVRVGDGIQAMTTEAVAHG